MADPRRMPQVNAEVTAAVEKKLDKLERELKAAGAHKREIVALLIQQATAADIALDRLMTYRTQFAKEKDRRTKG